jgi:hypothetical protein|tara:strand:+ start:645 stop:1070 length:426 start_codon:yes stop_codon:yes gene_type:complete
MKKKDLKELMKPLVKECIHELLIEEGLLSNVVAEVAKGMQGSLMVENAQKTPAPQRTQASTRAQKTRETNSQISAQRKKMMDAIGKDTYNGVNLFEGTTPMSQHESTTAPPGNVDMGAPADSGVDISSLMGGASAVWEAMK